MAEIDRLEFVIKSKADTTGVEAMTSALNGMGDAVNDGQAKLKVNEKALKGNEKQTNSNKTATDKLGESIRKSFSSSVIGKFVKSIGRIAFYRAIRSIIKDITAGIQEGKTNLYQWSKYWGENDAAAGRFAKQMDSIKTNSTWLKNGFGTIAASFANVIEPLVERVVNRVMQAIEWVNIKLAQIRGDTEYYSALKVYEEWEDDIDDANKAAKKLKATILGIDEINPLNGQNAGRGSASKLDDSALDNFTRKKLTDEEIAASDEVRENFEKIKDAAIAAAAAIAGIKLSSSVLNLLGLFGGGSGGSGGTGGAGGTGGGINIGGILKGLGLGAGTILGIGSMKALNDSFNKTYSSQWEGFLSASGAALANIGAGAGIGAIIGGAPGALVGSAVGATSDLGIMLWNMMKPTIERFEMAASLPQHKLEDYFKAVYDVSQREANNMAFDLLRLTDKTGHSIEELVKGVIDGSVTYTDGKWSTYFLDLQKTSKDVGGKVGKTLAEELAKGFQSKRVSVPVTVKMNGGSLAKMEMSLYASGAMGIKQGQMFIAGENGAELVGQIGNQTAVANTQQIVQGIASGVNQAQSVQNALLREQNNLLREIASKDYTAKISTMDILNGLNNTNIRTGKMLVPVQA